MFRDCTLTSLERRDEAKVGRWDPEQLPPADDRDRAPRGLLVRYRSTVFIATLLTYTSAPRHLPYTTSLRPITLLRQPQPPPFAASRCSPHTFPCPHRQPPPFSAPPTSPVAHPPHPTPGARRTASAPPPPSATRSARPRARARAAASRSSEK